MSVKSKTIPFSLEVWHKYKGISEVITRGGSKVEQLTLFSAGSNQAYPLVGVTEDIIEAWTKDGEYWEEEVGIKDLMLKVYTGMPFNWQIYSSFEDMLEVLDSDGNKVIKVEIDDPLSSYPLRTERGWYEINGKCCVEYLPNLETMILKQDILTTDNSPKFKEGIKHIIHYRKQGDKGICPLSGITFVGVEDGKEMLIYASVCSGDNFSKAKGVEIALSRNPLGVSLGGGKESLFSWIEAHSNTLPTSIIKLPNSYRIFRKEVLGMINKA